MLINVSHTCISNCFDQLKVGSGAFHGSGLIGSSSVQRLMLFLGAYLGHTLPYV
jgi:hypothetical protein